MDACASRVGRHCPCGVLANYGLVPSELGVGLYCGHMVDHDLVSHVYADFRIIFDIILLATLIL